MKWSGSVIHMIVTLRDSGHPELSAVNQWFGHVTDPRAESFDTTLPEFATPFWLLSQSVAGGEGMPTADDFAAVAALGGGWLFADLTDEEFAAEQAAAEIQTLWIARSAVVAEGIHDGTITTIEQIIAVIGGE